jgi:uncharacterized protein YjdB
MKHVWIALVMVVLGVFSSSAQEVQPYIRIDQFGYRPNDAKTAVIIDPQIGFNAKDEFIPGKVYQVRRKNTQETVYQGSPRIWNLGKTSEDSGDRGWWFDFSQVTDTGEFYIFDLEKNVRSYYFDIRPDVYKDVLKAACKMFYYQRLGIEKEAQYAGEKFADGYAVPMDSVCADVFDKTNPAKVRDMRGGWMDAGDNNKYVTFCMEPVNQLLNAYKLNPGVFTDDFNIPESGNGVPDILDEIKWQLDWLKRMQDTADGGAYLKMGHHNPSGGIPSPPSKDLHPRYYFSPKSSAATIDIACMLAHAYLVYKEVPGFEDYAADCLKRAIKAWNYFNSNPMNFNVDTGIMGGGDADRDENQQKTDAVIAAIYLFAATGEDKYHQHVLNNYSITGPFKGNWGLYGNHQNQAFMYYAMLPNADPAFAQVIRNKKISTYNNNEGGWTKWDKDKDIYRAYMMKYQYHWGSNQPKANIGNTFVEFGNYFVLPDQKKRIESHALDFLHYFHGVNPFGMTYITNMEQYGAEKSARFIWHQWFKTDTCPPGYIPGGPNKYYKPDASFVGVLEPPMNQPEQKSYKDWSKTWPDKAWEVTEPGIYYQAAYVFLLSSFAGERRMFYSEMDSIKLLFSENDTLFSGIKEMVPLAIYPLAASANLLKWETDDPTVVDFDNHGNIIPKQEGKALIRVIGTDGKKDSAYINVKPCISSPFAATPVEIPGIVEMENYDKGCNTYYDSDAANKGNTYRLTEGVDIQATNDKSGSYHIGWVQDGEWVKYSLDIKEAGTYVAECRIASVKEQEIAIQFEGLPGQFVYMPSTGGYNIWKSVYSDTLRLSQGQQTMTVSFFSDGINFNYIHLRKYVPVEEVVISDSVIKLKVKELLNLSAEVKGGEGAIKDLSWSSSDETVARVDQNGRVFAAKEGEAYIYATSNFDNKSDSVLIVVYDPTAIGSAFAHTDIGMSVYPNPINAGKTFNVRLVGVGPDGVLEVTNVLGKSIYKKLVEQQNDGNLQINTVFPKGIYIVKFYSDQWNLSRKLIVE